MSQASSNLPLACRGVRGAITVDTNTREAILDATRELLAGIAEANDLYPDDLTSIIFTATGDLNAAYPAEAARQLGWTQVPLLCMQEIPVAGSLEQCIRVLIHWNTARRPDEVQHIYLRAAQTLRPDLAQ